MSGDNEEVEKLRQIMRGQVRYDKHWLVSVIGDIA